jgi:hypothetical protein
VIMDTALIATRPFEVVPTAREVERTRLQNEANERAGNFDHLNTYGVVGDTLTSEWCRVCTVWRPPRAAHCYTCGGCVQRLDHHCTILGACVGLRNHRFFIGFILCVGLGACTLLLADLTVIVGLVQRAGALSHPRLWTSLLLLVVLAPAACVLFVAYFHCWLLVADITMREKYGRKRKEADIRSMTTKEKMREIWEQMIVAPIEWKRDTPVLIEKRIQRARTRAGVAEATDATPSERTAMLHRSADEDEQVGCTGGVDFGTSSVVDIDPDPADSTHSS